MRCLRRVDCLLILMLAVLVPCPVQATDQFEPVRECINQALTDSDVPSIAVAVAHRGEIIWDQGFGLADREQQTRDRTYYVLGGQRIQARHSDGTHDLGRAGLIDLDKPIDEYLGDAKLHARVGSAAGRYGTPSRQPHVRPAAALPVFLR